MMGWFKKKPKKTKMVNLGVSIATIEYQGGARKLTVKGEYYFLMSTLRVKHSSECIKKILMSSRNFIEVDTAELVPIHRITSINLEHMELLEEVELE
jgi:hypothetical protein